MTTTTRTWTIEHDWTCGHCRHVNPGRNDECANCGKHIDSTHEEMAPTDMSYENRVKDTARFEDKRPDWMCGFCDSRVQASHDSCHLCGAKKGEKKGSVQSGVDTTKGGMNISSRGSISVPSLPSNESGPVEPVVVSKPSSSPSVPSQTVGQGPYRETVFEEPEVPGRLSRVSDWASENFSKIILFMVGTLLVGGLVCLLVWLFSWHDTTAQVAGTRWNYHVSLHQRQIDHGRDWRDQEHAHAFNETCHSEIRSYHNCNPHNCNPHPESYSCNCQTIRSCRPVTSCRTTCTSSGNRSSSCSESCSTSESCSSSQSCSTCYRTVYDTCYDRCPDYDQMCDYDYPSWPEVNHADTTNVDHTLVRPALSAPGDVMCPGDAEMLNIQNHSITQCTTDTIGFTVNFNAGTDGSYTQHPESLREYNRYLTGARWNAQYNHAGQFRTLSPQ